MIKKEYDSLITNYRNSLKKVIEHEKKHWDRIFRLKLENSRKNQKKFSSFWDEDYYSKIKSYVNSLILDYKYSKLLEAGSGSGRASIILNKNVDKTMLDISPAALQYSKHIAKLFKAQNISYVIGNIFDMPFDEKTFDFVWNLGVVEHYDIQDIRLIFSEMMRVTNKNGIVAIGIPNFYSGPILKAWILKAHFFKFISGYRLDTEYFHDNQILKNLLICAAKTEGRKVEWIESLYFGNPLPTELPRSIIKTLGKFIEFLFPKNKFLILIVCKLAK